MPKLNRFINAFGTHYVTKANMGALYGEQTMINRESYTTMVSDGIDIDLFAGFSAIFSVNSSLDINITATEIFKSYSKEQILYSRGAAPPTDGNSLAWMTKTFEEPYPYTLSIAPIGKSNF